jgi:Ran GTPase-activating protein (RanGAP) involved in mRNA processing and transport
MALADSPHAHALNTLGLAGNDIGPEGLNALLHSRSLWQLRRLNMASNRITDAALAALANHGTFPHLTELDLRDNPFRGIGIRALIHAPLNRPITRLRLSQIQVDPWLLKPLQQRYGTALRIE